VPVHGGGDADTVVSFLASYHHVAEDVLVRRRLPGLLAGVWPVWTVVRPSVEFSGCLSALRSRAFA